MSINSLTEAEIRRSMGMGVAPAGTQPLTNTLSMLVKYIPTESVTLYVAALSAAAALKSLWPWMTELHIYWFFAFFTPVLFVLIFLGKRRASGPPTFPPAGEWPWWKLFACTVAFLVWALAVPGNPYIKDPIASAAIGFLALFISTVLSVLEPLFDRKLPMSEGENSAPQNTV
jgi:hypothetical protein